MVSGKEQQGRFAKVSETSDRSAPRRELTLFDAICMMVGIIVGVGIFETSPAIAASLPNGWAVLGIWAIGGLLSLCGALCYAELASAYPDEGGDYVYLNRAYGGWVGYLFAWGTFVIVRPGSIAAMAFPFARYARTLWPPAMDGGEAGVTLLAVAAVVCLTFINCIRVQTGARTQNVLTLVKVVGLGAVCVIALVAKANTAAEIPGTFEGSGVALALILVLFTYGGWQEIVYAAGEVKNPTRYLTRSIVAAVIGVTVIYLLANFAFLRVLGLSGVAASPAVATEVVEILFPQIGGVLIAVLICVSALGAINGLIFTGARVSYALGRDYPLFALLAHWDKGSGTPITALLIQGLISVGIIVICGSFSETVVYTTATVWLFFAMTGAAVMVLRRKDSQVPRPFRVPGYPFPVLVFCITALYLAYSAFVYNWQGSLISIVILFLGLLFFRAPPRSAA